MSANQAYITSARLLSLEAIMIPQTLKIVGLTHGGDGRSCSKHDICGEHVTVGSVLVAKKQHNIRHGQECIDIALYADSCKVGYLAKQLVPYATKLHNKRIEVIDVTSALDGGVNRRYNHYQNYGCALGKMIN